MTETNETAAKAQDDGKVTYPEGKAEQPATITVADLATDLQPEEINPEPEVGEGGFVWAKAHLDSGVGIRRETWSEGTILRLNIEPNGTTERFAMHSISPHDYSSNCIVSNNLADLIEDADRAATDWELVA